MCVCVPMHGFEREKISKVLDIIYDDWKWPIGNIPSSAHMQHTGEWRARVCAHRFWEIMTPFGMERPWIYDCVYILHSRKNRKQNEQQPQQQSSMMAFYWLANTNALISLAIQKKIAKIIEILSFAKSSRVSFYFAWHGRKRRWWMAITMLHCHATTPECASRSVHQCCRRCGGDGLLRSPGGSSWTCMRTGGINKSTGRLKKIRQKCAKSWCSRGTHTKFIITANIDFSIPKIGDDSATIMYIIYGIVAERERDRDAKKWLKFGTKRFVNYFIC